MIMMMMMMMMMIMMMMIMMMMMKIIMNCFVAWLTDERHPHHRESPTQHEHDLNLRKI